MSEQGTNSMELIRIELLRPIEGHSKKRVKWLKDKILEEGIWSKPICIEKNHFLVLDGMHRFEVARELCCAVVPCELFDYAEVDVWSLRKTHEVSRRLVIQKALAGDIYPYKTAKHRFPRDITRCGFRLDELKGNIQE